MTYNFAPFKKQLIEVEDWLRREYQGLRTGRATPLLLDRVMVKSYDSRLPVKQVAAISIEDAKTLRVSPWDKGLIKEIESAIAEANLGVSTAPDGTTLRIVFPALTAERRSQMERLVGEKLEEAKVSLRGEREKIWSDVQAKEKEGTMSEDEKFRAKNDLQKLTDEAAANLSQLASKKEVELHE